MIQFYAPDIEISPVLPESESAHCCRVLRMQPGDRIMVTDGKGFRYLCEILDNDPRHTALSIKEKECIERASYKLTLAVAPTKNMERMEWMAEKAVEIGVDRIVLLQCARSERRIMRRERLVKVLIAAMKQSLSASLPELTDLIPFSKFIKEEVSNGCQKFFGYCSDEFPKKEFVKECRPLSDVIVMIGPEGDFSLDEVQKAVDAGFMPVSLGNKRLRTETAGVFVAAAVNVINQLS